MAGERLPAFLISPSGVLVSVSYGFLAVSCPRGRSGPRNGLGDNVNRTRNGKYRGLIKLLFGNGEFVAGRRALELDEVVVGAVGRHQRAGVPDVLALGTRLAAPVCADGASADGFLFLVSCC